MAKHNRNLVNDEILIWIVQGISNFLTGGNCFTGLNANSDIRQGQDPISILKRDLEREHNPHYDWAEDEHFEIFSMLDLEFEELHKSNPCPQNFPFEWRERKEYNLDSPYPLPDGIEKRIFVPFSKWEETPSRYKKIEGFNPDIGQYWESFPHQFLIPYKAWMEILDSHEMKIANEQICFRAKIEEPANLDFFKMLKEKFLERGIDIQEEEE